MSLFQMLTLIDNLLNRITMYRLVLYYLIALLGVALILGALGILPYNPGSLVFSTVILIGVSWATNKWFADAFKTQTNSESFLITALILALIITPIQFTDFSGVAFLFWAAILAMASKYILAARKKHLFNPAAVAVVVTSFAIAQSASWWVGGNLPMMAFVIIGGLLIVRKIQRFDLVIAFFAAAIISIVVTSPFSDPLSALQKAFLHAPLFFFAFIMLTEPLTTPPTRELRIAYGALVGFLFSPHVHIGSIYSTPELALIAGNIFSYIMSPKAKYLFTLKEKNEVGTDTHEFVFASAEKMKFRPGQYMEWTLGHERPDARGNRRYFTIASSPTERHVRLGVKFYESSSSFKKKLLSLQPGDKIMGGQLAGDFVLPEDAYKKLVFIAGGIGVTPFRSMVKYLVDREEHRSITMLYSNRNVADIAYRELFDEAREKIGMKTIYVITGADQVLPSNDFRKGFVGADLIRREVPDYAKRMFYISGTHAMVASLENALRELGVPRSQIKVDFFPGFA